MSLDGDFNLSLDDEPELTPISATRRSACLAPVPFSGPKSECFSLKLDLVLKHLEEVNQKSFLRLLTQLTDVGVISEDFFKDRLNDVKNDPLQHMLVVEDSVSKAVVATGAVVIEPKFIHQANSQPQPQPQP